ncbi:unnamed protein product [Ambrosiozyma monospora]|uniref:Unnamed protein product n=1 Tax=Ambrosiozyma monospora TaxID=43982 RepID=A0A9W6YYA4_AMBMO|nr:unnamed protein product [Ambrosiozyma monospora]
MEHDCIDFMKTDSTFHYKEMRPLAKIQDHREFVKRFRTATKKLVGQENISYNGESGPDPCLVPAATLPDGRQNGMFNNGGAIQSLGSSMSNGEQEQQTIGQSPVDSKDKVQKLIESSFKWQGPILEKLKSCDLESMEDMILKKKNAEVPEFFRVKKGFTIVPILVADLVCVVENLMHADYIQLKLISFTIICGLATLSA